MHRLVVSKELADVMLEHYNKDSTYLELLSLAHDVYSDVNAQAESMACLVKRQTVYNNDKRQHNDDTTTNTTTTTTMCDV